MEPEFDAINGIYRARWATPVHASIEIDMVRQERSGDVSAEVTVRTDLPTPRDLHTARMTISGTRARADLARYLATRGTNLEQEAWAELIEQAFVRTIRAFRDGAPAIYLWQAVRPVDEGYSMPPLAHAGLPTILFGDGGAGKSWIALAVAAGLQAGTSYIEGMEVEGQRNVAYLDYEMTDWENAKRLRSLAQDLPDLLYVPMVTSLRESVDRLRRIARDKGIRYWVVDSAAPAAGGEPESAEVAAAYFNALRAIGGGSLTIAHVRKDGEGSEHKPFGSAFWHNLARLTYYAKGVETPDGLTVGLFNRKNTIGSKHAPLAVRLAFDRDAVSFRVAGVDEDPELARRVPIGRRIRPLLEAGKPLAVHEIANALGATVEGVRLALKRDQGVAPVTGPDGVERWTIRTGAA